MDFFSRIKSIVPHFWFQNASVNPGENPDSPFELKKRSTKQASFRGILKKKFLQKQLFLDDPRSPSTAISRTPIRRQWEEKVTFSPFNVDEMLQTVDDRVNLSSTPKKSSAACFDMKKKNPVDINNTATTDIDSSTFPDYDNIIGTIDADWADFEFHSLNKTISESLLVEISNLDLGKASSEQENKSESSSKSEDVKAEENVESTEVIESVKPKIIACIQKEAPENNENSENATPKDEKPHITPKKLIIKRLNDKRAALTPLSHVKNSPMKMRNADNNKENALMKKKKINSGSFRKLPAAPSTPLTPLFKQAIRPQRPRALQIVDKENM